MIMSEFLEDLGKGIAGSVVNGVINNGLGLLGQDIVNKQARDNYKWQYDNFLSPKAQVKALTAAGLNPAAVFGNNAPVLNSGGMSVPSNPLGGIGTNSLTDISNYLLAKAQAHKAGVEAEGTELDNIVKAKTQEERIREVTLRNNWTEEDITRLIQQWNKTVAETNVLAKDAEIKKIDLDKHKELVNAIINSYVSRSGLDNEQANNLRQQLPLILDKLQHENDVLSVDADVAKDFKSTMAGLGVVGQGIKILQTLLKILK